MIEALPDPKHIWYDGATIHVYTGDDIPPTPEMIAQQHAALSQAIGECVTAWSNVELQLSTIFRDCVGSAVDIADSIWASVISFDGRRKMLHSVLRKRLGDSVLTNDWKLFYNHIGRMNERRNEVVHATMLNVESKVIMLEPYFVMSLPKQHLSISDVKSRTSDFCELANALNWLSHQSPLSRWQQPAFLLPIPDLLLRLRAEANKSRKNSKRSEKSTD